MSFEAIFRSTCAKIDKSSVKKNFVPVFAGCSRIDEAINKLINHHEQVCEMWEQGENREHCRI
jgi:hypothetical protein